MDSTKTTFIVLMEKTQPRKSSCTYEYDKYFTTHS